MRPQLFELARADARDICQRVERAKWPVLAAESEDGCRQRGPDAWQPLKLCRRCCVEIERPRGVSEPLALRWSLAPRRYVDLLPVPQRLCQIDGRGVCLGPRPSREFQQIADPIPTRHLVQPWPIHGTGEVHAHRCRLRRGNWRGRPAGGEREFNRLGSAVTHPGQERHCDDGRQRCHQHRSVGHADASHKARSLGCDGPPIHTATLVSGLHGL